MDGGRFANKMRSMHDTQSSCPHGPTVATFGKQRQMGHTSSSSCSTSVVAEEEDSLFSSVSIELLSLLGDDMLSESLPLSVDTLACCLQEELYSLYYSKGTSTLHCVAVGDDASPLAVRLRFAQFFRTPFLFIYYRHNCSSSNFQKDFSTSTRLE